ncbi:helix-turn-helix domain-containing protein [Enterococcus sp. DIV0876]|uniref:helix-turn-helix domain-containing protein n=1 Tax=Enterococcus sp. DIV0876 TaxID=2774633 RepID=UPI003D2FD265
MEFHLILKEKRKELGLTQEELATKLSVSRSAISNWEIGRNYPDIQTLIVLANTLNVSIDYLLNEDLDIARTFDSDRKQKKQFKLATIFLSSILFCTLFLTVHLFMTRQPVIKWIKENESPTQEVSLFSKKEIKQAYVKNNILHIVLDKPSGSIGYYLEHIGEELSVEIYKQYDLDVNNHIPLEGVIKIDLTDYGKTKNIKVYYS